MFIPVDPDLAISHTVNKAALWTLRRFNAGYRSIQTSAYPLASSTSFWGIRSLVELTLSCENVSQPSHSSLVPAAVNASPAPSPSLSDVNPFEGKDFYANPIYTKLETTIKTLLRKGEILNAGRVRTIHKTGTFG